MLGSYPGYIDRLFFIMICLSGIYAPFLKKFSSIESYQSFLDPPSSACPCQACHMRFQSKCSLERNMRHGCYQSLIHEVHPVANMHRSILHKYFEDFVQPGCKSHMAKH
ncbi:uncharacterized protein LOC107839014 [Capsicum annuum]|uniref:uncharacterized protein LOC107839014 n=1 Tax=Capsicum annuum TaxID=4072 RepID=UPI0007BEEC5C|nr:uncharacterized protein LOC107839014 [Capsicum annuum]